MKVSNLFKKLSRDAFLAFLLVILSLLSYFTGIKQVLTNILNNIGISNQTLLDILVILIVGIVFFTFLLFYDLILRKFSRKNILISYESEPLVIFSNDASGLRIDDFQNLRAGAKESIFVMGVGMTYFSSDQVLLKRLLDKNIAVRLLMVSPEIIDNNIKLSGSKEICISEDHFEDYFCRVGYTSEIRASSKRLVNFIESRKQKDNKKGKIELRVYPYLIPINFTIADEYENGKMLLEYAFPFSANRVRIKLSRKDNRDIFNIILEDIENLWNKSVHVTKDFEG